MTKPRLEPVNYHHVRRLQAGRDPRQIVERARNYTMRAIDRLALIGGLIEGKSLPKLKVLDKDGNQVEIDQEIPPAVQVKALELLIERACGKSPQAILLGTDAPQGGPGGMVMSIYERIEAIKAARNQNGNTIDLEASQQHEMDAGEPDDSTEIVVVDRSQPAPVSPRDLI